MNSLERKVLELIGEDPDSPDVFTDDSEGMAQIRDSISDAIAEIVMLTGGFKRQYFLPLRAGQAFYKLIPQNGSVGWITDVWAVNRQRRLEQTDLIRLCHYDPRWMISSAEPTSYLPVGMDLIGFHPKPSASSDVMEITIVEIPEAYETGADRIKLRDSFQYATVHYAVSEFWASRGDANEAQAHMLMYMEALGLKSVYQQSDSNRQLSSRKEPWSTATS